MKRAKNQLNKLIPLPEMKGDEKEEDMADLMKKNSKISFKTRQEGNQLYTQIKNHNENVHKSILSKFSKSIAFASVNSEELAQAYSNRSVILIHIHRFQECLIDIQSAFKLTNSEGLKTQLQTRKERCLSLMDVQILSEYNSQGSTKLTDKHQLLAKLKINASMKLPQMIPSQTLPCASEAVALEYNETSGRHFVATRDIKPGEIIIIEDGYVCFPNANQRYIVCSHCLQFSWNGIPCESCSVAMFCSESCKNEAWKHYHDIECRILPYLPYMHCDTEDFISDKIIAVRLFIKAVKKEGLDCMLNEAEAIDRAKENNVTLLFQEVLEHGTFRSFYNLSSSVQNTKNKDTDNDSLLSKIIGLLLNLTNIFDEKKDSNNGIHEDFYIKIKQILQNIKDVININCFNYEGSLCTCQDFNVACSCSCNRGVFAAPFSSFINHSCAPNVNRLFLPKKKIVMYTTAPVKKGDQLYGNYGPSLRFDRSTRQKCLLQNFHFTCKCKACTENWPTLQQLELVVEPISESNVISQVMTEFKKYYPDDSVAFLFHEEEDDAWPFTEETLGKSIKMSELIYKYCNNHIKAFLLNSYYRNFIDRAFYKLYGERCRIPSNCYEI